MEKLQKNVMIGGFGISWNGDSYIVFPSHEEPWRTWMAEFADSWESNWTNPNPLLLPFSSVATLQDKIVPNLENIS